MEKEKLTQEREKNEGEEERKNSQSSVVVHCRPKTKAKNPVL